MKYALIILILFVGCSAKGTGEPFIASSVSTPFSASKTKSGEALRINFKSQKCISGVAVPQDEEIVIPFGAIKECSASGGILSEILRNVMFFGSGFWAAQ